MRAALPLLLALCAAVTACQRRSVTVPAPPPPPPPLTAWPAGKTAPERITESLVLEIPLAYERSAIDREQPLRSPFPSARGHTEARFDFFLPDFSGYTLTNYRKDFDENKVEVVYLHEGSPHEGEPDAPGEYPPNMLKRALRDSLDPDSARELYGLRCYADRQQSGRLGCYGRRDPHEDLLLYTLVPPYPADLTFPQLQARYFSQRYGGVRIYWRTHVKNLPRWREIDAQIWKWIEAWNVAAAAAPAPH